MQIWPPLPRTKALTAFEALVESPSSLANAPHPRPLRAPQTNVSLINHGSGTSVFSALLGGMVHSCLWRRPRARWSLRAPRAPSLSQCAHSLHPPPSSLAGVAVAVKAPKHGLSAVHVAEVVSVDTCSRHTLHRRPRPPSQPTVARHPHEGTASLSTVTRPGSADAPLPPPRHFRLFYNNASCPRPLTVLTFHPLTFPPPSPPSPPGPLWLPAADRLADRRTQTRVEHTGAVTTPQYHSLFRLWECTGR